MRACEDNLHIKILSDTATILEIPLQMLYSLKVSLFNM